jgi:alkylhydroperoxidase family enzyme
MAHLVDEPLPVDVYSDDERTIIEYSRALTRMQPIDDELYGRLSRHFSPHEIIELCFTVGLSNIVNRFHATFLTDVDQDTLDAVALSCPLPLPELRKPRRP